MPNCGRAGPKTPSPPRWKRSWHQAGPAVVPLDPLAAAGISASPVFWTQKVLWVLGQLGWVLTCTRGGPTVPPSPPSTPYLHDLLRYLPRLVDVQDDFGVSHHRVESPSFAQAGRTGEGRR